MALLDTAAVSYQIVLTKADKISIYELADMKTATEKLVAKHPAAFPFVLATSSETGEGMAELRAALAQILADHGAPVR